MRNVEDVDFDRELAVQLGHLGSTERWYVQLTADPYSSGYCLHQVLEVDGVQQQHEYLFVRPEALTDPVQLVALHRPACAELYYFAPDEYAEALEVMVSEAKAQRRRLDAAAQTGSASGYRYGNHL